jgi:NADH dehydrogenase FAD-containing subunit
VVTIPPLRMTPLALTSTSRQVTTPVVNRENVLLIGKPSKRVVIIGANFAGLSCAQRLSRRHAVTVVDSSAHFEFLPNIHELLSGVKKPALLRLPRERLLHRLGHTFLQDTVLDIDAYAGAVTTAAGRALKFDACVVAVGGMNNTYGISGVAQFTRPFKSVEDCAAIASQLAALLKAEKRTSVVIVGAGLAGVEALGEILRRYRHRAELEVHIVEGANRLVPSGPEALNKEILKKCRPYPVNFHLDTQVTAVTKTRVKLSSGKTLRSDLTLWTGGAAPPPLLVRSGLAPDEKSWAPTHGNLLSRAFDNVLVSGDAADPPQQPYKQAYHALAMGACAADNTERLLCGRALKRFRPGPELSLISLGDLDTYLLLGKRILAAGPVIAPAKELVFQANMALLDPPLGVKPALDASARYWQSLQKLLLPTVWPPASIMQLTDLRLLPEGA